MGKLRERRAELQQTGQRAPRTHEAYASDWRVFERWCVSAGRVPLPASIETLELYLVWTLEQERRKVTTASRHATAIAFIHRQGGHPSPVTSSAWKLLTTVKRERKERPKQKAALTVEQLRTASEGYGSLPIDLRNRAVMVLGFATGLRRSEISRLDVGDVQFEPEGLKVTVHRSKRDQLGKGRLLGVFAGVHPATDPVRVVRAWLDVRGSQPGPLFLRVAPWTHAITAVRLGDVGIADVVKAAARRIGIDPRTIGAHSLRAGMITTAAEHGASDLEIMAASGHASARVMRDYVRSSRVFARRNPLASAL